MKIFLLIILALFLPFFAFTQNNGIEIRNGNIPDSLDYIVNGEKVDKETFFDILKNNNDIIKELTVLKETPSPLIGESAKTIALIITLKDSHSILISANGFDGFLITQPPKEYFTKEMLRNKNILLVNEWNRRYENISHYDSSIYGMRIDYDAREDYDLAIEYQLYMFFKFMEKGNSISLGA